MKNTNHSLKPKVRQPSPVFIVTDNEHYLFSLGFRLLRRAKNLRYKIKGFTRGEKCLESLHLQPTVIIIDYSMNASHPGEMRGKELLRKISQTAPGVPVVILTEPGAHDVIFETYDIGAYIYIRKDYWAITWIHDIIKSFLLLPKFPALS